MHIYLLKLHNNIITYKIKKAKRTFEYWHQYLSHLIIYDQGFLIFNWLKVSLDSEDGFREGCQSVCHQQQSPITQIIIFNKGTCMLLLSSNRFLFIIVIFYFYI